MSGISAEQIEKYFELVNEKIRAINRQAEIIVINSSVWEAISNEQYASYKLFDQFQNSTTLKSIVLEVARENDLGNDWVAFESKEYFKEKLESGFTKEYGNMVVKVITHVEDMLALYEELKAGSVKKMMYFIGARPDGYFQTGIEKIKWEPRKEVNTKETAPSEVEEAIAKVFNVIADVGSGKINNTVAGYASSVKKIVFGIIILMISIFMLWLTYFAFSTNTMMFAMLAAIFTIIHFVTGISKLRDGIREYKEFKAMNDENGYM